MLSADLLSSVSMNRRLPMDDTLVLKLGSIVAPSLLPCVIVVVIEDMGFSLVSLFASRACQELSVSFNSSLRLDVTVV